MTSKSQVQRRNPLALRSNEPVGLASERGSTQLSLADIRTDGGTQMRAGLDEETVREYLEVIVNSRPEAEWPFPPVVVFHDGEAYWMGDGFHRVEAARRYVAQVKVDFAIPAHVRSGTRRDAILHAAGANAQHGLRRTNADKRRAVEVLLHDPEWGQWSDREIARRCQVDHKTVAAIRADLTGEIPQLEIEGSPSSGDSNLTGEIPQLKNKGSLSESDNQLTGEIPQLESDSQLTGEIPQLESDSQLTGEIPQLKNKGSLSDSDSEVASAKRTYRTRHGTIATMRVGGQIEAGRRRRSPSTALELPNGWELRPAPAGGWYAEMLGGGVATARHAKMELAIAAVHAGSVSKVDRAYWWWLNCLRTLPAHDANFKEALENATSELLREALIGLGPEGASAGHKTRIERIEAKLRHLDSLGQGSAQKVVEAAIHANGAVHDEATASQDAPTVSTGEAVDEAVKPMGVKGLLHLYQAVVATLPEYAQLTGKHTQALMMKRGLVLMIEELKGGEKTGDKEIRR